MQPGGTQVVRAEAGPSIVRVRLVDDATAHVGQLRTGPRREASLHVIVRYAGGAVPESYLDMPDPDAFPDTLDVRHVVIDASNPQEATGIMTELAGAFVGKIGLAFGHGLRRELDGRAPAGHPGTDWATLARVDARLGPVFRDALADQGIEFRETLLDWDDVDIPAPDPADPADPNGTLRV